MKIAVLPGDGIGPEIVAQAVRVLEVLTSDGMKFELETALLGGCAVDATGNPFPEETRKLAIEADALLLELSGVHSMTNFHVKNVRNGACYPFVKI